MLHAGFRIATCRHASNSPLGDVCRCIDAALPRDFIRVVRGLRTPWHVVNKAHQLADDDQLTLVDAQTCGDSGGGRLNTELEVLARLPPCRLDDGRPSVTNSIRVMIPAVGLL